jgi:IS605 OrfB family transposase
MEIKRTINIMFENDEIQPLVKEYNRFQNAISEIAFNDGKPLSAVELHNKVYYHINSSLPSQMKCSAIRGVAGTYASAKKQRKQIKQPFKFKKQAALFLHRRDFSFIKDKISIITANGRKKLDFVVPEYFKKDFDDMVNSPSILITSIGQIRMCITLEVPEPKGIMPVGVDLGVNNPLVLSTGEKVLFVSGNKKKMLDKRTRKTKARLQKKLSDRKAQSKDTRSVRRGLKRLGRKQSNRTKSFCRETASKVCKFIPENSVIVLEDLRIKQVRKDRKQRKGTRRKLANWSFAQISNAIVNKAERMGIAVDYVNPAYTSQRCSKCGLIGIRNHHKFSCSCGFSQHADINAADNIRLSYAVLRSGGLHINQPRSPVVIT